jgi:hypothetical protein
MLTLKEKVDRKTGHRINLYKPGGLPTAFEQSAL